MGRTLLSDPHSLKLLTKSVVPQPFPSLKQERKITAPHRSLSASGQKNPPPPRMP